MQKIQFVRQLIAFLLLGESDFIPNHSIVKYTSITRFNKPKKRWKTRIKVYMNNKKIFKNRIYEELVLWQPLYAIND